jgi:hypothetical protein
MNWNGCGRKRPCPNLWLLIEESHKTSHDGRSSERGLSPAPSIYEAEVQTTRHHVGLLSVTRRAVSEISPSVYTDANSSHLWRHVGRPCSHSRSLLWLQHSKRNGDEENESWHGAIISRAYSWGQSRLSCEHGCWRSQRQSPKPTTAALTSWLIASGGFTADMKEFHRMSSNFNYCENMLM